MKTEDLATSSVRTRYFCTELYSCDPEEEAAVQPEFYYMPDAVYDLSAHLIQHYDEHGCHCDKQLLRPLSLQIHLY